VRVVLVDPGDLGRMPHLFTLKAITYWRGQGADVRVAGPEPPLWAFDGEPPDLVQITTPLFSWDMAAAEATVRAWSYRSGDVEVGGVLASNFPARFAKYGVKVHHGIRWEIESARPACEDFPDLPISRFFATHGCGGCPLGLMVDPDNGQPACLVPRFEGRQLRAVPGWEGHVCDRHGLRELMDNALNMASPEVLWRVREAITRPTNLSSGVEANTMDDRAGEILGPIPFRPWRTAFDETREERGVVRTIGILKANGVDPKGVHVYVLYGHRDDLADAEYRVRRVFELGAWPFAMRYVPLNHFAGKRDYLPPAWDRQDYVDFARWVNVQKRIGLAKNGRPQLDRLVPFERWKREGRGHP
jgi:hypothetical protein